MRNPFVTKGYAGAEYFCDRQKETKDLVQLLTNENNLALISPRRLGKTDLIHHCFNQKKIKNNYYTFLIDIYPTSGAFINKYQLMSSSSVSSALKALLDKDFITQEKGSYMVYDQFFALWLKRN